MSTQTIAKPNGLAIVMNEGSETETYTKILNVYKDSKTDINQELLLLAPCFSRSYKCCLGIRLYAKSRLRNYLHSNVIWLEEDSQKSTTIAPKVHPFVGMNCPLSPYLKMTMASINILRAVKLCAAKCWR